MIITKNILRLLKNYMPKNSIIVEAGAFSGRDSLALATLFPDATIYSFEPVPEIFAELVKNTANFKAIHPCQQALSDKTGTTSFYISQNPKKPGQICQAGSLLKPKERLLKSPIFYPGMITVSTITLDEWSSAQGINQIDFLWFDMQGNELAALKGATKILKTVKLLSLEVNFIEAYENQPAAEELDKWVMSQGFTPIARDYEDDTSLFFGNILYQRNNSI